jgi:hypothetical protein
VFEEHYSEVVQLKDMITSEEDVLAVGYDNVGGFWLDEEQWTTHEPPYTRYTEGEMLQHVGLSRERYHRYLELLGSIGGYRVTRSSSNERVSILLRRAGNVVSGETVSITYLSSPPTPLTDDTGENASNSSGIWFSRLQDNWYVERER